MHKEDIPLYKLDLTAKSKYNKVTREKMERDPRFDSEEYIFIPQFAPFYTKSVELYEMDGTPLEIEKDYEFYGILGKLTQFTGKEVGLFIKLKNTDVQEWYITYQVVGNFNKLTSEILNMLRSIQDDDRMVNFPNIENFPLWLVPERHQHDLAYDFYGFQDLVVWLNRVAELVASKTPNEVFLLNKYNDILNSYINEYKRLLLSYIKDHDLSRNNNHGLTKAKIGKGNVDNFNNATFEQALEGLRADLHLTPYVAAQVIEQSVASSKSLLASGSIPILFYDGANATSNLFILTIPAVAGAVLGGRNYDIPGATLDLKLVDPSPANKTFYVYLTYSNGLATYTITTTLRSETPAQSLVKVLVCDATKISSITNYDRYSLDGYVLRDDRRGSAILSIDDSFYLKGDTTRMLRPVDLA